MSHPTSTDNDTAVATDTTVTVFCADWCTHCRSFREAVVGRFDSHLVWFDVEDDAIDVDALDITAFPTVAVFHPPGVLRYLGPVKPYRDELQACIERARQAAPQAVPSALAPLTTR